MGKRSDFERKPRDFYPTPYEAIIPLLPHIRPNSKFAEPCCGNGALIHHTNHHLRCYWASDIERRYFDQDETMDALLLSKEHTQGLDYIITNPPWDRKILHPMIMHFKKLAPTWLLFDADWMHTKQSVEYINYCHKIVSVGRVKWFGNMTGKDNCAWYLFKNRPGKTIFYGRMK